jgi:hypothetical protein
MVAFVPANLPSNINTVEQVLAWSGLLLGQYFNTQVVREVQNATPTPVIENLLIPTPADGERLIVRASLRLNADFRTNTSLKFFRQVNELGAVSGGIPSAWTT